jgi:hypothetical protein
VKSSLYPSKLPCIASPLLLLNPFCACSNTIAKHSLRVAASRDPAIFKQPERADAAASRMLTFGSRSAVHR